MTNKGTNYGSVSMRGVAASHQAAAPWKKPAFALLVLHASLHRLPLLMNQTGNQNQVQPRPQSRWPREVISPFSLCELLSQNSRPLQRFNAYLKAVC